MIWETVPAPLGSINGSSRLELKRLFFEKPTTAQVEYADGAPRSCGEAWHCASTGPREGANFNGSRILVFAFFPSLMHHLQS